MKPQPSNTFLKNLLKCSIENANANAKWQERDAETEWFQKEIYIHTRLDRKLLPDLLDLKYPLVFLSGTPGSGKTQFLKRLKSELLGKDSVSLPPTSGTQIVATFQKNGKIIRIKHDATQVESEIDDAAEKLGELLEEDWSNSNFERQDKHAFYVIGINQGVLQRLCDLDGFQRLGKAVRDLSDSRILVVDLSKRSAISPRDHQDAFVTYLLLALTEEKHWEEAPRDTKSIETCYGCELLKSGLCPILANVQWLRRESVWPRIHDVFELNHYISGNVTTFRDVLAILSKAIAGYLDYYRGKEPCEFIRAEAVQGDSVSLMNLSRLLIYNGMFCEKDPYGEYLDCLELTTPSRERHVFYGYCGPYFSSERDALGAMAMLDPFLSDSDELRELDDEIFNFPKSLLSQPDGPFEKSFFESIEREVRSLEIEERDDELNRSVRWKARGWLLFCLVRLGRRRFFLLGEKSCKQLSQYEHAASFSETILKLAYSSESGYTRQLVGDMKIALTAFSGTSDSGTMKVSHGSRDSEIVSFLAFDASFKIYVVEPKTQYIEYFPREIYLALREQQQNEVAVKIPPLKIDLEVWECLQRARNGFSASYLGIDRAKAIEGFLQGLRSVAWELQNCKLVIDRGDTRVIVYKDQEGPIIQ